MYAIFFTETAKKDVIKHKKSGNLALLKKLNALLKELQEHPHSGSGKPEQLRGSLAGLWSRRINRKHRLIYSIHEDEVIVNVISARGHYDDR